MEKKNKKRLGIVVVMLVLILAIGATAGTTLAKYISSASHDSSATVAKWGYTLSVDAGDLFGESYGKVDKNTSLAGVSDKKTVVVSAAAEHNVVAPGTTGSMTIILKGTAEVNAKLTIDVNNFQTVVLSDKENKLDSDYYPLKWTVNETDVDTTEKNKASALGDAIADALNDLLSDIETPEYTEGYQLEAVNKKGVVTVNLPAGTSLGEDGITLTISWKWEFENGDMNAADTLLGYIAAGMDYSEIKNIEQVQSCCATKAEYNRFVNNSLTEAKLELSITFEQTQEVYAG